MRLPVCHKCLFVNFTQLHNLTLTKRIAKLSEMAQFRHVTTANSEHSSVTLETNRLRVGIQEILSKCESQKLPGFTLSFQTIYPPIYAEISFYCKIIGQTIGLYCVVQ